MKANIYQLSCGCIDIIKKEKDYYIYTKIFSCIGGINVDHIPVKRDTNPKNIKAIRISRTEAAIAILQNRRIKCEQKLT